MIRANARVDGLNGGSHGLELPGVSCVVFVLDQPPTIFLRRGVGRGLLNLSKLLQDDGEALYRHSAPN